MKLHGTIIVFWLLSSAALFGCASSLDVPCSLEPSVTNISTSDTDADPIVRIIGCPLPLNLNFTNTTQSVTVIVQASAMPHIAFSVHVVNVTLLLADVFTANASVYGAHGLVITRFIVVVGSVEGLFVSLTNCSLALVPVVSNETVTLPTLSIVHIGGSVAGANVTFDHSTILIARSTSVSSALNATVVRILGDVVVKMALVWSYTNVTVATGFSMASLVDVPRGNVSQMAMLVASSQWTVNVSNLFMLRGPRTSNIRVVITNTSVVWLPLSFGSDNSVLLLTDASNVALVVDECNMTTLDPLGSYRSLCYAPVGGAYWNVSIANTVFVDWDYVVSAGRLSNLSFAAAHTRLPSISRVVVVLGILADVAATFLDVSVRGYVLLAAPNVWNTSVTVGDGSNVDAVFLINAYNVSQCTTWIQSGSVVTVSNDRSRFNFPSLIGAFGSYLVDTRLVVYNATVSVTAIVVSSFISSGQGALVALHASGLVRNVSVEIAHNSSVWLSASPYTLYIAGIMTNGNASDVSISVSESNWFVVGLVGALLMVDLTMRNGSISIANHSNVSFRLREDTPIPSSGLVALYGRQTSVANGAEMLDLSIVVASWSTVLVEYFVLATTVASVTIDVSSWSFVSLTGSLVCAKHMSPPLTGGGGVAINVSQRVTLLSNGSKPMLVMANNPLRPLSNLQLALSDAHVDVWNATSSTALWLRASNASAPHCELIQSTFTMSRVTLAITATPTPTSSSSSSNGSWVWMPPVVSIPFALQGCSISLSNVLVVVPVVGNASTANRSFGPMLQCSGATVNNTNLSVRNVSVLNGDNASSPLWAVDVSAPAAPNNGSGLWLDNALTVADVVMSARTALVTLRGPMVVQHLALNMSNITDQLVESTADNNNTTSMCTVAETVVLGNSTLLFEGIDLRAAITSLVDVRRQSEVGDVNVTVQSVTCDSSIRSIVRLDGNVTGGIVATVMGSNLSMMMGAVEWAEQAALVIGEVASQVTLVVSGSYVRLGNPNASSDMWSSQGCGLILLPPVAAPLRNTNSSMAATPCSLLVSNSTVLMWDVCALVYVGPNRTVGDATVQILNDSRVMRGSTASQDNSTTNSSIETTSSYAVAMLVHANGSTLLRGVTVTVSASTIGDANGTAPSRPLIVWRDNTSFPNETANGSVVVVQLLCADHAAVHIGAATSGVSWNRTTSPAAAMVVLEHASMRVATHVHVSTMANVTAHHLIQLMATSLSGADAEANRMHNVSIDYGASVTVDGSLIATSAANASWCLAPNATAANSPAMAVSIHVAHNATVTCSGSTDGGGAWSCSLVRLSVGYANGTEQHRCGERVAVEVVIANGSSVSIAPAGDRRSNASSPLATSSVVHVAPSAHGAYPWPTAVSVTVDGASTLIVGANGTRCTTSVVLWGRAYSSTNASSASFAACQASSLALTVSRASYLSMMASSEASAMMTSTTTSPDAVVSLLLLLVQNDTDSDIEALGFGGVFVHASEGSNLTFTASLSGSSDANVTEWPNRAVVDAVPLRCSKNVSVVMESGATMRLNSSSALVASVHAALVSHCPSPAVAAMDDTVPATIAVSISASALHIVASTSANGSVAATTTAELIAASATSTNATINITVSLGAASMLHVSTNHGAACLACLRLADVASAATALLFVAVSGASEVHVTAGGGGENDTAALIYGALAASPSALRLDVNGASTINVSASGNGSAAGCRLTAVANASVMDAQRMAVLSITEGAQLFVNVYDAGASDSTVPNPAVLLWSVGPILCNVTVANASVKLSTAWRVCAAVVTMSGVQPVLNAWVGNASLGNASLISVVAAVNASVWISLGSTTTAPLWVACSLVSVANSTRASVQAALYGNVSCGASLVSVHNATGTGGVIALDVAPETIVNTTGPLVSVGGASNVSMARLSLRDRSAVGWFGNTSAVWVGSGSLVHAMELLGGTLRSRASSSCLTTLSDASSVLAVTMQDATVYLTPQATLLPLNQTSLVCFAGTAPSASANATMLVDGVRFAGSSGGAPYLTAPVNGAGAGWSSLLRYDITFGCVMANDTVFVRYPMCLVNASCAIKITCPIFIVATTSLSLSRATASVNGSMTAGTGSHSASESHPTRTASGGTITRLRNSSSASVTHSRPSHTATVSRSVGSPSTTQSFSASASDGTPSNAPSASRSTSTSGSASSTTTCSRSHPRSTSHSIGSDSPTQSPSNNASSSHSRRPSWSQTLVVSPTGSRTHSISPTTTNSPLHVSTTKTIPVPILAAPENNTALIVGLGAGVPLGLLLIVGVAFVVHRVWIAPRKTFASLKEDPTNYEESFDGVNLPRDVRGLMVEHGHNEGGHTGSNVEMLEQPFVVVHGDARYVVAQEDDEGFYDSEGYYHYYVEDD